MLFARNVATSLRRTATTTTPTAFRNFSSTRSNMVKIVTVLYDGGKAAQEEPRLLGTTENCLGLREYCKKNGHELIVTSDKEGPNSVFQKEVTGPNGAEILVSTPFHPAYLTKEIIDKSPNLKLAVTAGIGSDHVDLNSAAEKSITVAEVTGSNVVSVAEHVIMTMLILVRNYNVGHAHSMPGGKWDVGDVARNEFDLEGKVIGTIGAGRIGYRVLERLRPFDPKALYYYDYTELPAEAAKKVGVERVKDLDEFLQKCDVVTVNCPLHEGTVNLINKDNIKHLKGKWLVNTARGAICNAEAVAEAVNSGHLLGYGGDVWNKQPFPEDHPWKSMIGPNGRGNAMTLHTSGTSLDAQARYAKGTIEIIDNFLNKKPQRKEDLIVDGGAYASKAYGERK